METLVDLAIGAVLGVGTVLFWLWWITRDDIDTEKAFLEELLHELVSDGHIHPEHPIDCGCVYSRLMQLVGRERTQEIIAHALREE